MYLFPQKLLLVGEKGESLRFGDQFSMSEVWGTRLAVHARSQRSRLRRWVGKSAAACPKQEAGRVDLEGLFPPRWFCDE